MNRRNILKGSGLLALGAVAGAAGGATLPFFQHIDVTASLDGKSVPTPSNSLIAKLTTSERDYRWNKTRELLQKRALSGLIAPSVSFGEMPSFATYLANSLFMRAGAVVFPVGGEPKSYGNMVMPFDGSWINPEPNYGYNATIDFMVSAIKGMSLEGAKIGTVGIEKSEFGYHEFTNDGYLAYPVWRAVLNEFPNVEFVDITAEYSEAIAIKSEEDLEVHKQAALIGEGLHDYLVANVKEGTSDREIKAMVDYYLAINNAQADVKALMLMPGLAKKGGLINSEYGIKYNGGYAQCTLCISVGEPNKKVKEMYASAKESLAMAMDSLRPGATFGSVIDKIGKVIKDAGYWHMFPQVHGLNPISFVGEIGITPEEYQPTRGADMVLQEGMLFSLENAAILGSMPLNQVKLGGTGVITSNGFKMWNTKGLELQVV